MGVATAKTVPVECFYGRDPSLAVSQPDLGGLGRVQEARHMEIPQRVQYRRSPEGVQGNLAVDFSGGNVAEEGLAPLVFVGEKLLGAEPQGIAVELHLQFGAVAFQVAGGIDTAFPIHIAVGCEARAARRLGAGGSRGRGLAFLRGRLFATFLGVDLGEQAGLLLVAFF